MIPETSRVDGVKAPRTRGLPRDDGPPPLADGSTKVGTVTSGTVSPCLNAPIAMGYVETALGKNGTELTVDIRGKKIPTKVAKMPFVEPATTGACPSTRLVCWNAVV